MIGWVLSGRTQADSKGRGTVYDPIYYEVPLPAPGEAKRAIMDSYTKEHSAEYQSQALIDLAFRMREKVPDTDDIERVVIHTSHHTHYVIGTGANDPQKMDPKATPRDARTTPSCTSSPSPCRTGAGTTWTATPRSAPAGPTRSGSGTRSRPARTRSGPAATTRATRTSSPSAPASRSS